MKDIKIDIDTKKDFEQELFKKLVDIYKIHTLKLEKIRIFETFKGYHIYADFEENDLYKSEYAKIIIQAYLGSDMNREMFNLKRLDANNGKTKFWNILFCRKYNKEKEEWIPELRRVDIELSISNRYLDMLSQEKEAKK